MVFNGSFLGSWCKSTENLRLRQYHKEGIFTLSAA